MEERLRSDLAASPLYSFVREGWLEWGQEIVSVQVREDDFLLYVLWGLDLIKQEGMDVCKNFRSRLYIGLRNHFLDCGYTPHQNDLDYISNLTSACCLYCYGLVLTDVYDASDVYSGLVSGFGKHWSNVKAQWDTIRPDMNSQELKKWIIEYVKSDEYYTSGERIAWLNEDGSAALVNIPGIAGGKQQLSVHNYIQNFHNEAGAVFKDESITINVNKDNG